LLDHYLVSLSSQQESEEKKIENYQFLYTMINCFENVYQEVCSPANGERRTLDVHHRRNYYIVPQNYLGQDIYIRVAELKGFPSIIKLPSGGANSIRVPIPKNSMHSHLKQKHHEVSRSMITVVVAEAEVMIFI
jgi:hypothetical protein